MIEEYFLIWFALALYKMLLIIYTMLHAMKVGVYLFQFLSVYW